MKVISNALSAVGAVLMRVTEWVIDPIQRRIGINNMGYLFVLPNMLIFGIFVLFPVLLNIYYSTTGGTNLFPADREFVGLANYQTLFECDNFLDPNSCNEDLFWRAFYNTITFVVFQVVTMVTFALLTAIVLNRDIRARGFFRSVFFYPVLLSPVVVALTWKWIVQRNGVLNALLGELAKIGGDKILIGLLILLFLIAAGIAYAIFDGRNLTTTMRTIAAAVVGAIVTGIIFGLLSWQQGIMQFILTIGQEKVPWLVVPPGDWATFWVIFVSSWAQMGFYTLILLAGLQAIPRELYEASSIDGANGLQAFRGITMPLLMPTMFVVLVLSLIRAVQVFDQVYVLTGGGPGTATAYIVQYIYQRGFVDQIQQRGLAASASVILGLALLALTLIQLRLGQESELA